MEEIVTLWQQLFWPMLRLLLGLAVGLLVANLLEALRWTRFLTYIAAPLSRAAHLRAISGAAFSMAFISPATSNSLLAESYEKKELTQGELILSNLFNSLPAYLIHTPTIFLLTWPVLGFPACIYVGLTLLAAAGRTFFTLLVARVLLPPPPKTCLVCPVENTPITWHKAVEKAWQRFTRRVPKLLYFTIPIYILMYILQQYGFFHAAELWLAKHADWLSFLKPQAMGIVVLHLAAELGAALSAAGSVLNTGGLTERDVVLALLVGNILSTPMRAIRHQMPSYVAFFRPALALRLVLTNQGLRALSMVLVTLVYYFIT